VASLPTRHTRERRRASCASSTRQTRWGCSSAKAGGAVSDGHKSYREIVPTDIGQRVPIYIGGKREIAQIEEYVKKSEKKE